MSWLGTRTPLSFLRASHRVTLICAWICVCAVVAGVALAQAPPRLSSPGQVVPVTDQEPITPIPPPPAADPLKVALDERLFNDTRLSASGNLTCSSCHDLHTNGARRGVGG